MQIIFYGTHYAVLILQLAAHVLDAADEIGALPDTIFFLNITLSPCYTKLWGCVLVRFVGKTQEKGNRLAFLPNAKCNIEK